MDFFTILQGIVTWAIVIGLFVGIWKVFVKAGLPGWGMFIPIYNVILMLKMAGKPWFWIFFFCIPLVNIVIAFIVAIRIAHNFGKSTGFGVGLALLGIIFYPILGYGDAVYKPVE